MQLRTIAHQQKSLYIAALLLMIAQPGTGKELTPAALPANSDSTLGKRFDTSTNNIDAAWIHHIKTQPRIPDRDLVTIEREIKRCWFPPQRCESKVVIVSFDISNGKDVSSLCIEKSSDNKQADDAACEAVRNATPFTSLMVGKAKLQFIFDYELFKSGSKNFHQWWQ